MIDEIMFESGEEDIENTSDQDEALTEESDKEKDDLYFITVQSIKDLINDDRNIDFKQMLITTYSFLMNRGFLNYFETKKEIEDMRKNSINIDDYRVEDTEIGMYHRIMNDIDQQRSRLSDIMSHAQADLFWVDKTYETLFNIWVGKFSVMTSDKKREGEAEAILHFIFADRMRRREIHDTAKNKFNLLNSKMDTISRKVTIAMELRKSYPGNGHVYDNSSPYRATLLEGKEDYPPLNIGGEEKKSETIKKKQTVSSKFSEIEDW